MCVIVNRTAPNDLNGIKAFELMEELFEHYRRLTEQDVLGLALSQDGLKYSQQGFGQLLLQVVLCVDGNVVLQHEDRVLKRHVRNN